MRRTVRAAAAAASLALAAGLAGCSQPLPVPTPDALPAATPPAMSVEQAERILDEVADALAAADVDHATAALFPRVVGPAAQIRSAEYRLAGLGGDPDAVTSLTTSPQTIVLPTTDTWPRTVMVITQAPADLQAPLLLTLVQATPRAPYALWSWARLFPGVSTPVIAQPEVGSDPVAPDVAGTLAVSPTDVLAQYVDLLTNRDQSPYAGVFTDDPMRQLIWDTRDGWLEVVGANGTLAETYAPGSAGVQAIATADGGALVVGTISTTTTITLTDSTLKIGDQTAVFLGTDTVKSNLSITWASVVAFVVPPAGADAQIQVLGGEHSLIQVTGQ